MKKYQNVEVTIVLCNCEDIITKRYGLPEVEIFSAGSTSETFYN